MSYCHTTNILLYNSVIPSGGTLAVSGNSEDGNATENGTQNEARGIYFDEVFHR